MYELIQVGENTYYIDCPTNIGIYVYGHNKVCMIEGGSDNTAAKKALDHITANGWQLEMILNTHCHADHTGGCAFLKEQTGCNVYAPGPEASIIQYSYLNSTVLFGGFPAKELDNKFTFAPPCECLPVTEKILPPGMEFIHTDGHSFEQLAYRTPDDIWFVADAVIAAETLPKYKISFLYNIEKHLDTLERLKKLKGRLFIPAHRPPLKDIAKLAEINRINTLEVADDIKRFCRGGITIDALLERIFKEYSIRLYVMQYALVGFTTRSYLAWLERKGEIAPVFDGTKLLWKTNDDYLTPELW